jgi:N-acetylglucosamine kinase-like BadF-type ATPase
MKLIADSGSTKTDWKLIANSEVIASFQTEGLNPFFKSKEKIVEVLETKVVPNLKDASSVLEVNFYGAGCSSNAKKEELKQAFQSVFKTAIINIAHDLLGAAIALCGNNAGIVAILGTGSNSCLFDGANITEEQNSLGYILGDEGAGSNIGKQLMIDFLYQNMPAHIHQSLKGEFNLSKEIILDKVYKEPLPNRFLASFLNWVGEHIDEEDYLQTLVLNAFDDFFKTHLINYSNYREHPINVVGSVGYFFKEYLHIIAFKYEVKIGKVIKAPIDGLVDYHK